ncbi:MAG: nickel pincer cofactor biosynthesis protein LarB [Deltaproteobacteria bacterium]|nr:nickel pincer cofactor biosynthesis protein LarB [Deltaproteobacteria bacterium]
MDNSLLTNIANLDVGRLTRNGFHEVVFAEGKEIDHLLRICRSVLDQGRNLFGTRTTPDVGKVLVESIPKLDYDPVSRTFQLIQQPLPLRSATLAILAAGTADIPVAEEARRTAQFYGVEAKRFYDVGIAGLHRLLSVIDEVRMSDCVIAVAGMEGALPSVVGGLVKTPVIAVPTSVGYGTNMSGQTALFAMLTRCAEGVSVVNIDNGFGAACAALRIFSAKTSKKV